MIDERHKKAKAEVGAIAKSKRALDFLLELDGEPDARLTSALSATVFACRLKLKGAQSPLWTDGDVSVWRGDGFGRETMIFLEQSPQVLCW
jgi:hypothetical protein